MQLKDVDFKRKRIAIRNDRANRSRDILIGSDLNRILKSYQDTRPGGAPDKDTPFFVTTDGATLNETTVAKSFQRARAISGITRSDGAQYQPRLHGEIISDLRSACFESSTLILVKG